MRRVDAVLNGASVGRIATAIHAPQDTATLLDVLQETLIMSGLSGVYTLLFTDPRGIKADVCASTCVGIKPGAELSVVEDTLGSSMKSGAALYLQAPQAVAYGADEIQAAAVVPLQAESEIYGALLLHEVVPKDACDLVEFIVEQLGLSLLHVQLGEELRHRHAMDVAKLSGIAKTGEVLRELELDRVLAKLMELALSTVEAEVGCIVLRETDDTELECRIEWGLDGLSLQKLRLEEGRSLTETVVSGNTPLIVPNMAVENPFLTDPILTGIDSLAAVPLTSRQRVLGCLTVINLSASSERNIELLRTIAELSSTAIENALLHQKALEREALSQQLRIAGDIQRGLLPENLPMLPGAQISAWNKPCDDSGGDYYDFFQIDTHRVGFVVGDATGHGIGAALMATTVRAFLRALVGSADDLGQLFSRLNDLAEADFANGKFITLVYGIYDTRDRSLHYAGAGHCPPLMIYRRTHDTFERLKNTGVPLGIFAGAPYDQGVTEPLEVGDFILLLTDGVSEAPAESGEQFGEERLLDVIRAHRDATAADLIEIICGTVRDFCGAAPQRDDITLLCLRVTDD